MNKFYMKDHTGKKIMPGQKATMDSGHANQDDWEGEIIEKDLWLWFCYKGDGDEVTLTKDLCASIEIKDT